MNQQEHKKNKYTWHISIITNLRRVKQINVVEESQSLDIARVNAISKILKISRYGIACYHFKSNNNYSLEPMKEIHKFKEYYEITNNFIDIINSQTPYIEIYDIKIDKQKSLNFNAKPFFPSSI